MIDFNALKAPFDPKLISWRVGAMNKDKTKAIALAYLNARDVMERLDEVCGPANWQALYPHANGKTSCKIGIMVEKGHIQEGKQLSEPLWVWKENGSGDSDIEAEKGAFSDAFKRSAVLWGIGRYLYDVPNIWFEVDQYKKFTNPNDPRFAKALEQAAKGIRNQPDEPEPKPEKPALNTDQEDFVRIRKAMAEATDYKTLVTTWQINEKRINSFPRSGFEKLDELYKSRSMELMPPDVTTAG